LLRSLYRLARNSTFSVSQPTRFRERPGESTESWVRRSRQEAEASLLRIPSDTELVTEGLAQFEFLREKAAEGLDVNATLWFVCYFALAD